MANNPYVNKVEYAGQTLMDLTGDTVQPSNVLNGITFHDRSGSPQQGSMITHNVYDGLDSTSADDALSAKQGKVLNEKIPNVTHVSYTTTQNIQVPAYGMKEIGSANDVLGDPARLLLSGLIVANGYENIILGMNRYGSTVYVVARNITGTAKTITNGTTITCVTYKGS